MSTSAGTGYAGPTTEGPADNAGLELPSLDDTQNAIRALEQTIAEVTGVDQSDPAEARWAPEPPGLLGVWAHTARNSAPLLAGDAAVVVLASLGATLVTWIAFGSSSAAGFLAPEVATLTPALLLTFVALGLYPGVGMGPVVELRRTWVATTLVTGLLSLALALNVLEPWRFLATMAIAWSSLLVALPITRGAIRQRLAKSSWWGDGLIVLGGGPNGSHLLDRLQENEQSGLRPIGVIDDYHRHWDSADPAESRWYLGPPQTVASQLAGWRVRWAVVTDRCGSDSDSVDQFSEAGWADCLRSIPNRLVLTDGALPSLWTETRECGGAPALHLGERLLCPTARMSKRAMDIGACLVGGLFVGPLLLLLALAVKLTSKGPIFYAQKRVGMNGSVISVWKFRTMVVNAEHVLQQHLDASPELQTEWDNYRKLKKDPRITGIGSLLRKTSLDELPQLYNVLVGEMSLVGPRPLPCGDEPLYGEKLPHYLRVRPGITGLWQVSGRNTTTYKARVEYDTYYARNWSPWLDLHILMRTFRTVLLCEGAY